jgi:hypothetical protein
MIHSLMEEQMSPTEKPCILTSKSDHGDRVYFDGNGWTLLQANATVYKDYNVASELRERLQSIPCQPDWITVEFANARP